MNLKKNLKYLTHIESFIDSDLLAEFHHVFENSLEWNGKNTATDLFIVWRKMKNETLSETLRTTAIQNINVGETSKQLTTITRDQFHADSSNLISYSEESELQSLACDPSIASVTSKSINLSTHSNSASSIIIGLSNQAISKICSEPNTSSVLNQEVHGKKNFFIL